MKYALLFAVLLFLVPHFGQAQDSALFYPTKYPEVRQNGLQLPLAWAGGLVAPQFANLDLNLDGIEDLVVMDRSGNVLLPFLLLFENNQLFYEYVPGYAALLPPARNWFTFRDYNFDDKPDFWTYSRLSSGFEVWKNTSTDTTLSFMLADTLLEHPLWGFESNIFLSAVDVPALADVSGDGDLDILTFGVIGGYINYYEKQTSKGELEYLLVDECWGKALEASTNNNFILDVDCGPRKDTLKVPTGGPFEPATHDKSQNRIHIGSTLLALDVDGDGDQDMVVGDVTYNTLVLLVNGRAEHNLETDSIIEVIHPWPQQHPVDIELFPAAFYVDMDADGVKELISAPFETSAAQKLNQVWLYENTGTSEDPTFQFVKENFLQDQMIDLGSRTSPAFFDYDGDGDEDMFVATVGDYVITRDTADRIVLFENVGNDTMPVFSRANNDYLGLQPMSYIGLYPHFGDADDDGDSDLLLGTSDGDILFYENTAGTGTAASFTLASNNYHQFDTIGDYTTPFLYDYDGDGLNDLLIGESYGNINYYRNTGTAGSPSYTLVTRFLGNIRTNEIRYKYTYDNQGYPVDTLFDGYYFPGMSSVTVADYTGDNEDELVTGGYNGEIMAFPLLADPTAAWPQLDPLFYNYVLEEPVHEQFGSFSRPATGYLWNDTLASLVIGVERGGLHYFTSYDFGPDTPKAALQPLAQQPLEFSIFPNPNRGSFTVRLPYQQGAAATIEVLNMLGQPLHREVATESSTQLHLPQLGRGVYMVRVQQDGRSAIQKLVVQ